MKCLICDHESDNFKKYIEICNLPPKNVKEKLIRHQCPECDVIFGTPEMLNMNANDLSKMYNSHYTKEKIPTRERVNLSTASLLELLDIEDGNSCLNWGSGPGSELAKKVNKLGIDFHNYDPYGHDGYGMIIKKENLKTYDYIISRNVLEHFQDPISELLKMKQYLNIGGVMLHSTPCYSYECTRTKFHTFFFLGRSPYVLADKIGMSIEKMNKDSYLFY